MHSIAPEFVDSFPAHMNLGVLYVSIRYRTCGHLCCCGCCQEVVTPLSPAQWSLTYDGEAISLRPSVGNWALACQSHYWIRENQVLWARRFSAAEVSDNRVADLRALAEQVPETRKPQSRSASAWFRSWR
jgi:hypothetical protein